MGKGAKLRITLEYVVRPANGQARRGAPLKNARACKGRSAVSARQRQAVSADGPQAWQPCLPAFLGTAAQEFVKHPAGEQAKRSGNRRRRAIVLKKAGIFRSKRLPRAGLSSQGKSRRGAGPEAMCRRRVPGEAAAPERSERSKWICLWRRLGGNHGSVIGCSATPSRGSHVSAVPWAGG